MSRSRRALSRKWSVLEKRVEYYIARCDLWKQAAKKWREKAYDSQWEYCEWALNAATRRKELLRRAVTLIMHIRPRPDDLLQEIEKELADE